MKGRQKSSKGGKEIRARVNHQIDAKTVRVIGEDGEQLGVMATLDAIQQATISGVDLVEVSANADPPVCRFMDYGKYRYIQSKKLQDAKKKQTVIEVKEIKLRPKTEKHDLEFKIRNIKKFLSNKNKVKVTLRFRGREIVYAESLGRETLNKMIAELTEDATVLQAPCMEGRQMVMFLGPKG